MKKYLLLAALAMSLLLMSAAGCVPKVTAASNNLDEVLITLERTACFGTCPVYTLAISGSGTVVYEGEEFVTTKGRAEAKISQEKIKELVLEFESVDYFSLDDSYIERTITCAPTVITSITIDGKTKTIEHYRGDANAPEVLTELEDKIDEIVDSKQWIDFLTKNTEPDLIGQIDDVQQTQGGDPLGQLLVNSPGNKTSDKFVVTVTANTEVGVQSGEEQQQASFGVLNVGQEVAIWFSGPVMESYPAQVTADKVVITDTSDSPSTVGIGISCDEFLSQKNIKREIDIDYRGLLIVTLCSNPTTGFQWSEDAEISDQTVLRQSKHDFVAPQQTEDVGTAGRDVWEFRSLKKGLSTIYFEYSRLWEGGEKGEWTLELVVNVK